MKIELNLVYQNTGWVKNCATLTLKNGVVVAADGGKIWGKGTSETLIIFGFYEDFVSDTFFSDRSLKRCKNRRKSRFLAKIEI